MQLTGLDLFFWVTGLVGHLILLVILGTRRLAARVPLFTALIAANIARSIELYFVRRYGSWNAYYYSYLSFEPVDLALQLAVAYEIATRIFRPMGCWAKDLQRVSIWFITGSLAFAFVLIWSNNPAAHTWFQSAVIRGNLFSSILMAELLVGMVVLSVRSGLPIDPATVKITQGFGAYSLLGFLIEAGHSYYGVRALPIYVTLSHERMAVYLGCVLYWIGSLYRIGPQSRTLPEQMQGHLLKLHQHTLGQVEHLRHWRR